MSETKTPLSERLEKVGHFCPDVITWRSAAVALEQDNARMKAALERLTHYHSPDCEPRDADCPGCIADTALRPEAEKEPR